MRVIVYGLRRLLRSSRRQTLRLALVVALVSGSVLALAMGAERTATAPDRYIRAVGNDVSGTVTQTHGLPVTEQVAALPAAGSATSMTFVFGALVPAKAHEPIDALVFAGTYRSTGGRLTGGRDVNPGRAGEFVASNTFMRQAHASIGERFRLITMTQKQADKEGFDSDHPAGPDLDATLVGQFDGPGSIEDPTPLVVFPGSLLAQPVGVSATIMSVSLRPGADLAALRTQLDGLPDRDELSVEPADLIGEPVRRAIDTQSQALWLVAAVAALAAVAVLGQLATRRVRRSPAERARLSAVGYTRSQIVAESVGWAAVPLLLGLVGGTALAIALSPIFPIGFVRRVEPAPGLRVEPLPLAAAAVLMLVALVLWTLVALLLGRAKTGHRSWGLVDRVASRLHSPTAATGVRFAFLRSESDLGSVRGSVIGMMLAFAILVGTIVFGASLTRLVTDPARSGSNEDISIGNNGSTAVSPGVRSALEKDPAVGGLTLYTNEQGRIGGKTLQLVGMEQVKGGFGPPVLDGRLPAGENEIALGRLSAKELGVGVGDELKVVAEGREGRLRVVGLVVIPSIGLNNGVGHDGLLTIAGLRGLVPAAEPNSMVVKLSDGAAPGSLQRLAKTVGADPAGPQPASDISDLARIRSAPYLLAGVLGTLGLLTAVHAMLISVRNRRRDVAILRAIGADRRWLTRAVHWQATVLTLVPLLLGAPLGLVAGRRVFRAFADRAGTVDDPSVPFVLGAVLILGFVVIANLAAELPARQARHVSPGLALRDE